MTKFLLIIQITATLLMLGVIWIIQLVHYPSFSGISFRDFQKYHAHHSFWITPFVAPLMIAELITSVLLIFYPPPAIDQNLLYIGLALTLSVWASTFFIQIPLHSKLARGFETQTHTRLVNTNWIRTVAWSLRGGLMLYFLWKLIRL